jgi:hypothetical protein
MFSGSESSGGDLGEKAVDRGDDDDLDVVTA